MFKISLFTTFLAIFLQGCRGGEIDEVFRELYIVPDVIDIPPAKKLDVAFTNGTRTMVLRPGQQLPREFLFTKPDVSWPVTSHRYYYTLYMTGITQWFLHIDRNGIENFTGTTLYSFGYEWRRWIVVNIPGNDISKGETIYEYQPPVNPANAEITDRYVFFIFSQSFDKIKVEPKFDPDPWWFTQFSTTPTPTTTTPYNYITTIRDYFADKTTLNPTAGYKINKRATTREFVKKYKLGVPKFGNCFLSKWMVGSTTRYGFGPFVQR